MHGIYAVSLSPFRPTVRFGGSPDLRITNFPTDPHIDIRTAAFMLSVVC
jgi:hypothetical protein